MSSLLRRKKKNNDNVYLPLGELAQMFGYNHAYLSILARQGKFEAKKVQGRWFATESSVRIYFDIQKEYTQVKDKEFISLAKASEYVPYSQEYLSLLARRGKLPAKKIGRNWYTTREKAEEYYRSNQKPAMRLAGGVGRYSERILSGVYKSLESAQLLLPEKRIFRMGAAAMIIVLTFGLFGAFRFPAGDNVLSGVQAENTSAFQVAPSNPKYSNATVDKDKKTTKPVVVRAKEGGVLKASLDVSRNAERYDAVIFNFKEERADSVVSGSSRGKDEFFVTDIKNDRESADCNNILIFGDRVFENPNIQNTSREQGKLTLNDDEAVAVEGDALRIDPKTRSPGSSESYVVYRVPSCDGR